MTEPDWTVHELALDTAEEIGASWVRFDLAIANALTNNLNGDWSYPIRVIREAFARGMDCFVLFSGGPRITDSTWNALIPSDGRDRCRNKIEPEIYAALTAALQNFTNQFRTAALDAGRDIKSQYIQAGNEMGQGGVADCRNTDVGSYGDEGTWPDHANDWLTYFVANFNRRGIPLVAPTLEAQSATTYALELSTGYQSFWSGFDYLAMNCYESDASGYPANLRRKLATYTRKLAAKPGRFGGMIIPEFGVSAGWGAGISDGDRSDYLEQVVQVIGNEPGVAAAGLYVTTDPTDSYGIVPWPKS